MINRDRVIYIHGGGSGWWNTFPCASVEIPNNTLFHQNKYKKKNSYTICHRSNITEIEKGIRRYSLLISMM